jgi:hypothetical protein
MVELDARLLGSGVYALIAVEFAENHPHKPCIRDQFEAAETRRGRHVDASPLETNTVSCGLHDGVGFSVHSTHAVTILDQVSNVVAVG